jgi:hypothetical protein
MVFPVPTVPELAVYTGRPEVSFTSFATPALLQAAVIFTFLTELSADDYSTLTPDQQQLAQLGICAMGDYIYLRQPYAQVIASPMQNETIGSYSYSKPIEEAARNAQAVEVKGEQTGVYMFDLATRVLARRQTLAGVFFGAITGFEHFGRDDGARVMFDEHEQRLVLLGPADRDKIDFQFFDINSEMFPMDPGG